MVDIFLNYTLLLCFTIMILHPTLVPLQRKKKLLHSLLFVAIQVIIWTGPTYGISLIWCGQLGLIIYSLRLQRRRGGTIAIHLVAVTFGTLVIYYYFVKFPFIVTQAHLLFVVLGGFVTALMNYFWTCHKSWDKLYIVLMITLIYAHKINLLFIILGYTFISVVLGDFSMYI